MLSNTVAAYPLLPIVGHARVLGGSANGGRLVAGACALPLLLGGSLLTAIAGPELLVVAFLGLNV